MQQQYLQSTSIFIHITVPVIVKLCIVEDLGNIPNEFGKLCVSSFLQLGLTSAGSIAP
jgi:hypothetical protein